VRKLLVVCLAFMLLTIAGCASPAPAVQISSDPQSPSVITVTTSVAAPALSGTPAPRPVEPVPVTTTATALTSEAVTQAIMPNVVCMNLQAAQNAIQEAGVFFSRSEDATGKGRSQVIDSNWTVVSQSPAAGSPIGEGDAILSAVKIGEPGAC